MLHGPPRHSSKLEPWLGVAVKVMVVPRGKEATHADGQEIPPGLLVTMPSPGPDVFTDKVNKSGAGLAALIAIERDCVSD